MYGCTGAGDNDCIRCRDPQMGQNGGFEWNAMTGNCGLEQTWGCNIAQCVVYEEIGGISVGQDNY
jgi:hypothetical protein